MVQLVGPPAAGPGTIFFELEQLELVGARLELRGRWFGVRGRRFMRPSLTLCTPAGPTRLLADLEHKPWPAEEGEAWQAAFPWELAGEDVSDLELTVAPDITVAVPAPGATAPRERIASGRDSLVLAKAEPTDAEAVSRRLAEEQHRNQLLREQLEKLREAQVRAKAATGRRDAALASLEEARREREQAVAELEQGRRESDEAVADARAQREEAIQACELARRETAQARAERGEAVRAAERATSEQAAAGYGAKQAQRARDDALGAAEEARTETARVRLERDQLAEALEQARRERDGAVHAAGTAARERDKAVRDRDKALRDLDKVARDRDKALQAAGEARSAAVRASLPPAPPPRVAAPAGTRAVSPAALWTTRGIALVVFMAILVALAVIVKAF